MTEKNNRFYTPSGDVMAKRYKKIFDEETKRYRIVVDEEYNLQEEIQASSNLADLAILKARYRELGEVPNLPETGVNGIDTGSIPSNIHELYQKLNSVGEAYNALDDDMKQAFGSASSYVDAIINGTAGQTIMDVVNARDSAKKGENE